MDTQKEELLQAALSYAASQMYADLHPERPHTSDELEWKESELREAALTYVAGQDVYIDALHSIGDGRTPCRECRRPHKGVYADPTSHTSSISCRAGDGHAYQPLSPAETAIAVLSGVKLKFEPESELMDREG